MSPPVTAPTWIQTYTGRALDLDDPKPEQIDIFDIAHALAYIPRFTGHSRSGYSVGQHSLHVADLVPPELKLRAQLHDASEYAFGDWSSPLKVLMRRHAPELIAIEHRMQRAIEERFGLREATAEEHAIIKAADLVMLATERRDFMGESPRPEWAASSGYPLAQPLEGRMMTWDPWDVERMFIRTFRAYGGDVRCL